MGPTVSTSVSVGASGGAAEFAGADGEAGSGSATDVETGCASASSVCAAGVVTVATSIEATLSETSLGVATGAGVASVDVTMALTTVGAATGTV